MKVDEICSMDLHGFFVTIPESGEFLRDIVPRLENWLATQSVDISQEVAQRSIIHLRSIGKLKKVCGLYFKGANA